MTAMPALAQQEGEGGTVGPLEEWNEAARSIIVNGDEWFYEQGDQFALILSQEGPSELTLEEWECVLRETLDQEANNLVMIDYDREEGSSFGINTEADLEACGIGEEEEGEEPQEEQPEREEEEDGGFGEGSDEQGDGGVTVERAQRVETGAGGTANVVPTALAALAVTLLLGLATIGGSALRRGRDTG